MVRVQKMPAKGSRGCHSAWSQEERESAGVDPAGPVETMEAARRVGQIGARRVERDRVLVSCEWILDTCP